MAAGLMFGPFALNRLGIEKPLARQPCGFNEGCRPGFEWTAQPLIDGHTKAHLGSFDRFPWHMFTEHLAQVATYLGRDESSSTRGEIRQTQLPGGLVAARGFPG